MHISSAFDAGNIQVIQAADPTRVLLALNKDAGGEHSQWFYFRVAGVQGTALSLHITNAGAASYPKGWHGYQAVASYDRQTWFRVPTSYQQGTLTIRHQPTEDAVYYAYFAPYSLERHADLVAQAALSPRVRHQVLGHTLDGRDLDLLVVGEPTNDKPVLWVIARQHPGESMASWFMEGLVRRLINPACPVARTLLDRAVLYVVPHMNPDGSVRGHLRCNASGANLNREWHEPTLARSPEVKLVRDHMDQTGVSLCLDVHGDETLPYVFVAGSQGIPSLTARQTEQYHRFLSVFEQASPDVQTEHGYPVDAPEQANLSMCTNQIAERFGCLAMTLEMPFKDNANLPDATYGWSPERCKQLGQAVVYPLLDAV